ncbi:hypothetical protein BU14_2010s0001 [Porphyra umbilicalis]|uniref:MHD domain-containing protein n=1 Tax=Porphyra umbilicalis TaxID=2786 RepID=A0A1X6NK27_PORUM|nr:hypothetical protein BU14_2010s0001 [Porphyra umbilicalis]|eukprot:OSX68979.1 hypothetical protein BU14_2010s0001 [Porphyra umbilicalis]
MAISAIFILDARGKTLISRSFRGDVPPDAPADFKARVIDVDADVIATPFVHVRKATGSYDFVYVRHTNLFIVAVTRRNGNGAMMLAFLYKLLDVLASYMREVREDSVRENFVVIYELLDEMMDWGVPQVTETAVLSQFITQKSKIAAAVGTLQQLPGTATGAVSWRAEGIRHTRNEVFLDVIEQVNVLVSGSGSLLRSEILGKLVVKSYLSGMPDLKLGLNDKLQFDAAAAAALAAGGHGPSGDDNDVDGGRRGGAPKKGKSVELEDVKFHQCVRLARFENDRTISFVPPDGEFELMSYRLETEVRPLVWVDAVIEQRQTRVDYLVKARTQLKASAVANNVKIHLPVLPDVDTPKFQCSSGKAKYVPERDEMVWHIKQFKAGRELVMRGGFGLPSLGEDAARENATKRPITVEFEVPYFTVSGLQVRFLKVVENSGYQALPWVRYITQAGQYEIRLT